MKSSKKSNEFHTLKKPPLPHDFAKVKEELLSPTHKEEEIVNLGKNRGQYFIRIPSKIAQLLDLGDNDKIKIFAESGESSKAVWLEIIKGESNEETKA